MYTEQKGLLEVHIKKINEKEVKRGLRVGRNVRVRQVTTRQLCRKPKIKNDHLRTPHEISYVFIS
jgi:hypothetical protein